MTTLSAKIDELFSGWNRPDTPGFSLAVLRDGETVHQSCYGSADLENSTPTTPDSLFYIASVSKQFTAACVLHLSRSGAVSLDDEIHRYFPELPDYGHPITVSHLIHHTSGLRDYLDLWELSGRSFSDPMTNADGLALLARQRGLNLRFPDQRFTVICLSNLSSFDPAKQAHAVADLYLADQYNLADYLGTYYSEELDATYRLETDGPDLYLRTPNASDTPLQNTANDTFTIREWQLHFTRDGESEITSFILDGSRAKGIRFERRAS